MNSFIVSLFLVCLSWSPLVQAGSDKTTIVSFSRHTFRGVTEEVAPQEVSLYRYGVHLRIPLLSFEQNATPRGLEIARGFANQGLQHAASLAVKGLDEQKEFDGHWDEFRADLAKERTFWTAIKVREGLNKQIPLTGCKTRPGKSIDIVSTRHPVMQCITSSTLNAALIDSSDHALFKSLSQTFLMQVRSAIGVDETMTALPDYTSDEKEYGEVAKLALAVEMIASLGAPLPQLFKKSDQESLLKHGKAVLTAGLNVLGIRFFINNPLPVADQITLPPLKYMASRPKGSHTAVFTHDDSISAILHSLGFINSKSDPDQLAIYPLETIIFAFGNKNVSVVRIRPEVEQDGEIPGNFKAFTLWKGSRDEWDNKVREVEMRSKNWSVSKPAKTCLNALKICDVETLNVAY